MVIACTAAFGWLFILMVALRLGAAAKHGDELAQAAQRDRTVSQGGAQIVSLAMAAQEPSARVQPLRTLSLAGSYSARSDTEIGYRVPPTFTS
jgi:hypothetical protein